MVKVWEKKFRYTTVTFSRKKPVSIVTSCKNFRVPANVAFHTNMLYIVHNVNFINNKNEGK